MRKSILSAAVAAALLAPGLAKKLLLFI